MSTIDSPSNPGPAPANDREPMLRALSTTAFLIFFQAYMVAPLLPKLSHLFDVPLQRVGWLVPAYVLPYGFSTLFYGPLSDRIGRRNVLMTLMAAAVPVSALSATANTINQLMLWRVLAGLVTGGIIPLTLAMIGDQYPYRERGRPLGWVFGAIAGGMAFGSTLGAVLEPVIGWRGLFALTAFLSAGALAWAWPHRRLIRAAPAAEPVPLHRVLRAYLKIFRLPQGPAAFGYIFANGAFHSGIFTWLGLYFQQRYALGETGIGVALLGYGVPGLLLGPSIGKLADRFGRRWIITAGLGVASLVAIGLCAHVPVLIAGLLVTALSLGYDMSHPLLAGVVTSLDETRRGQATGLMAFCLFVGFGVGSMVFGRLLQLGLTPALAIFATGLGGLTVLCPMLFGSRR